MSLCVVYVTCRDEAEARKIARAVVAEKLAACANIFTKITSIYEWKGKLSEDSEAAMLLKTSNALVRKLSKRVAELHSYETPCIASIELAKIAKPYREWIKSQLSS